MSAEKDLEESRRARSRRGGGRPPVKRTASLVKFGDVKTTIEVDHKLWNDTKVWAIQNAGGSAQVEIVRALLGLLVNGEETEEHGGPMPLAEQVKIRIAAMRADKP